MSKWQIVSNVDNNYRWEISSFGNHRTKPYFHKQHHKNECSLPKLPSMADLLLEGCPTMLERECQRVDDAPIFRTGSGKSVSPALSSIAKSRSILGNGDGGDLSGFGCPKILENDCKRVDGAPMFLTGSGKPVAPKMSSIAKARSILGDGDGGDFNGFGISTNLENGCKLVGGAPVFLTGSGKSVTPKMSSIAKARSILGDVDVNGDAGAYNGFGCPKFLENEGEHVGDDPMFRTASGKSVVPKPSSIAKARSIIGDGHGHGNGGYFNAFGLLQAHDNGHGFSNSLFQTASGKKVAVSPAGIFKAKALLGVNGKPYDSSLQGSEPSREGGIFDSDIFGHSDATKDGVGSSGSWNATSAGRMSFPSVTNSVDVFDKEVTPKHIRHEVPCSIPKSPKIMFHTAGGRSLSVSADALRRAKSLLGDPDLENSVDAEKANFSTFSFIKDRSSDIDSSSADSADEKRSGQRTFTYLTQPTSSGKPFGGISGSNCKDSTLIQKLDFEGSVNELNNDTFPRRQPFHDKPFVSSTMGPPSNANQSSTMNALKRSSREALVDITNNAGTDNVNGKHRTSQIRRAGRRSHVSPFKRPRISKFIPPLNSDAPLVPNGQSDRSTQGSSSSKTVSTRYPPVASRLYIKEFLKIPPRFSKNLDLPDEVRWMNPENAAKYIFSGKVSSECIGVDAFCTKLAQSGASLPHISRKWVANHYKWIVWKLACYERLHSAKFNGRLLSVCNVLEELKYRYEREVNHAHRSAIKKILEGDASPSSCLILCISAIHSDNAVNNAGRIELTDGWYSVGAQLDVLLSMYLKIGKLFVGQKLRIFGARLSGWTQPVSPLEAQSDVNLLLHVNGTYRTSWADRLGFCTRSCSPLAFSCIKSAGGPVPRTLVGVTRVYPVLYREKMNDGSYLVRSEKAEAETIRIFNQRRSNIVEDITSDYQRGNQGSTNEHDSEDGAKILKLLENAAEPELLLAEMSSEQLSSFSTYQAKLESVRQLDMENAIEKAFAAETLNARDVTQFMRVRVVGLRSLAQKKVNGCLEGLITIWNPTEKQRLELVEGQAYVMSELMPLHCNSTTLFLQARGSTVRWKPLTSTEIKYFLPFFNPRESLLLSKMGEVPLSSEFDTAVLVLHVGHEYIAAGQKKQWVFVTDGSLSQLQTSEWVNSLLAINFCSPCTDDYSLSLVNCNLVGSVVGFCNLIKRGKDQTNNLWMAEATENTIYHINRDSNHCSHLRHAFASVQKWADISGMIIEKLKKKVISIAGDSQDQDQV